MFSTTFSDLPRSTARFRGDVSEDFETTRSNYNISKTLMSFFQKFAIKKTRETLTEEGADEVKKALWLFSLSQ